MKIRNSSLRRSLNELVECKLVNLCSYFLSESLDRFKFRWIFCQLEVLRDCLPSSVRRTLNELPESLDETYERILKEMKKPNKRIAERVLHCLVVAVRPLRVEELAEVLAVDFDDAEGIPRLNPDWRWEDQELALLLACSSLIVIVEAGDSRIVQFSHYSVKEFLTSSRLATASGEVSNYHFDSDPAHTILAQACLSDLLQIQDKDDGHIHEVYPLARYAAEHWTTHAQFGEVSSRLRRGLEYFFDADKPHFEVWLTLCDIDTEPNKDATFYYFASNSKFPAAPLYYAAFCGFYDLVEHLITKHPQDVNADGGYYVRPLVVALAGEHFQTADLLRHNGADLDVRGHYGRNPLHAAARSGNFEVVRKLIEYDPAYINANDGDGWTPLYWASEGHNFKDGSVVRLLLEHGADINVQNNNGWTPLHFASFYGRLEVVRTLVGHGADVEVKNNRGKTALQEAAAERSRGYDKVVEFLREYGAK
jgi:ankyrin repeat protein